MNEELSYLERMGLLLHCLVIPAAWGLLVEWLFHVIRRRREGVLGVTELEVGEATDGSEPS